jgi:hypothetical protein
MSATITANNGAGSITATTILSPYETSSAGRNVIHQLIGGGTAVSLVGGDLRSGTFDALFITETDAWTCGTLHRQKTTFTLTDTDRPVVGMTYVVDGTVTVALDPSTLDVWTVTVGYQEVTPGSTL